MKNITLTTTVTVNPVSYAIELSKETTGAYIAQLVNFKIKDNEVVATVENVNCKLRNLTNYEKFVRLLNCAYYVQSDNVNNNIIANYEQKISEGNDLTSSETKDKKLREEEIKQAYDEILKTFTKEEKAFS